MASTWSIFYEPHGKFVTCQRPIVITTKVTTGAVAHFKGKLFVNNTGAWVDTNVVMNAYGGNLSTYYEFNVAEYCKNYFKEVEGFYESSWFSTFKYMVEVKFKLEIYPVEYDVSGNLVPEPTDIKTTNEFIVVPTNTRAEESTSTVNDNIRLDKFVLNGGNDSSAPICSGDDNKLLTNMPAYNTMDISQGFYFFQNLLHQTVTNVDAKLVLTNSSGTVESIPSTLVDSYYGIHIHPAAIDTLLSLIQGASVNFLLDASGNLMSDTLKVQYNFIDSTTGAFVRSSPPGYYKLVDGMGCKSTTFIFRNMRGGFDFFTATGEHDVSVELSGSTFDRHTDFSRAESDFGLLRGQHNITNLWNSRQELHSVFSQPVSKEYAMWLEELIVSPQVWVVKDIKGYQDIPGFSSPYLKKGLVAINILKGSYKLHNTEKGRHFIEFNYALSENTITKKM